MRLQIECINFLVFNLTCSTCTTINSFLTIWMSLEKPKAHILHTLYNMQRYYTYVNEIILIKLNADDDRLLLMSIVKLNACSGRGNVIYPDVIINQVLSTSVIIIYHVDMVMNINELFTQLFLFWTFSSLLIIWTFQHYVM